MALVPAGPQPAFFVTREVAAARRRRSADRGASVEVPAFLMDRTPVTRRQFAEFVRARPEWRRSQVTPVLADSHYLEDWRSDLDAGTARARRRARDARVLVRGGAPTVAGRARSCPPSISGSAPRPAAGRDTAATREKILQWYSQPGTEPLRAGRPGRPERLRPARPARADLGVDARLQQHPGRARRIATPERRTIRSSAAPAARAPSIRATTPPSCATPCATASGPATPPAPSASAARRRWTSHDLDSDRSRPGSGRPSGAGRRGAIRRRTLTAAPSRRTATGRRLSRASRSIRLRRAWTDMDGKPVLLRSLRGKPVALAMVYTSCTTACPLIVADLKRIEAALSPEARGRVWFALFSFDSERDRPEALKAFARGPRPRSLRAGGSITAIPPPCASWRWRSASATRGTRGATSTTPT